MGGSPTSGPAVEVRHCHSLAEFEHCMRLERIVWGGEDIDVPLPLFVVASETGGQVLGAFARDEMVGFTLAMAAFRPNADQPVPRHREAAHPGTLRPAAAGSGQEPAPLRVFLHSHMTAVLPEYRDRGIGRQLKLFQRQDALGRGIGLVEWTFDPLEMRNAHFNLMRLGAIVRRLIPNCYGITSSPLHGGLPTDRLVAEWWLASPRVARLLEGAALPLGSGQASSAPTGSQLGSGDAKRVLVPANINELKAGNPAEAARVQARIREELQQWLGQDYVVTSIENAPEGSSYILEPFDAFAGELP